jgi:hypothetical protein
MATRDWRESPKYKRLLEPEAVFDLTNPEHRQLLIAQLQRDAAGTLADSLTCGVCAGDVAKAKIVTTMRADFAETIHILEHWQD